MALVGLVRDCETSRNIPEPLFEALEDIPYSQATVAVINRRLQIPDGAAPPQLVTNYV